MVAQMDAEGFGNCTNYYECEAACPKEISVEFIAQMNRDYLAPASRPAKTRKSDFPALPEHPMTTPRKVALVTGAATGIGRAVAVRFARRGLAIAVNCSRSEAVDQVGGMLYRIDLFRPTGALGLTGNRGEDGLQAARVSCRSRVRQVNSVPEVLQSHPVAGVEQRHAQFLTQSADLLIGPPAVFPGAFVERQIGREQEHHPHALPPAGRHEPSQNLTGFRADCNLVNTVGESFDLADALLEPVFPQFGTVAPKVRKLQPTPGVQIFPDGGQTGAAQAGPARSIRRSRCSYQGTNCWRSQHRRSRFGFLE